jgi:hypothetical protein
VNVDVKSDLIPDTDGTRDLGSSTKKWVNVFADNLIVANKAVINDTTLPSGYALKVKAEAGPHSDLLELVDSAGVASFRVYMDLANSLVFHAFPTNIISAEFHDDGSFQAPILKGVFRLEGTSGTLYLGSTGAQARVRWTGTADRIYDIPEVGSGQFVMTQGSQTIAGDKTFTGTTTVDTFGTQSVFSSGLKTNTIDEQTAGSGVTIDSVLCKDGYTNCSGGVYADNIYERTAAAGVTVDGVLLKDNTVDCGTVSANNGEFTTLEADSLQAQTTNGNLSLYGNGIGVVKVPGSTDSSSYTTGALVVSGGLGIAKKTYFNNDIHLPNGGTGLNWYHETTYSTTFSGIGFTSASQTIQVIRIGAIVMLRIPAFSGTASVPGNLTSATAIGANYRPTVNIRNAGVCLRNNGNDTIGTFEMTTGGIINFYPTVYGSVFSGTGTSGTRDCTVSYMVN